MSSLEPLMQRNFLEYASYSILDRAIPDLRDGCKPVQRRILHTLFGMNDGQFHKVANVIGETMKLHPHGDVSIGDALVVLANKNYFVERQGNFGNPITGHPAAAWIRFFMMNARRSGVFRPMKNSRLLLASPRLPSETCTRCESLFLELLRAARRQRASVQPRDSALPRAQQEGDALLLQREAA